MGIYVMTANVLKELLENHMPTANDFGNEVIPEARKMGYPVQVRRLSICRSTCRSSSCSCCISSRFAAAGTPTCSSG
jgi:hypothetical protein